MKADDAGVHDAQRFLLTPKWRRIVTNVTVPENIGAIRLCFFVGHDISPVWIDDVYLFPGETNLFRRDFQNGIVIVNNLSRPHEVQLEDRYMRIRGTGQDAINDGAMADRFTIAAKDAAILVRPDRAPAAPSRLGKTAATQGVASQRAAGRR